MSQSERPLVGIYGGSFNPPHISHVLACHFALCTWPLERILVIPNFRHPLDKELVSYEHRFQMAQLAFRHLEGWVEISKIEQELGGISYTIDTVRALKLRYPDYNFRVIVGSDILDEVDRWRSIDELRSEAPFLVIQRAEGGRGIESGCFLPEISSTKIRSRLRSGECVAPAVPAEVGAYIARHGLYRNG